MDDLTLNVFVFPSIFGEEGGRQASVLSDFYNWYYSNYGTCPTRFGGPECGGLSSWLKMGSRYLDHNATNSGGRNAEVFLRG